jgi:predicted dehydrogenase
MSNNIIRVGVIGAGANTVALHIPGLQAQKGVEVVAVANRTRASGAKVAKAFGIAHVADSWEDIIYNEDVDAVCIGTWPYMHAPLTIAALEAGKHVLCEARMAMNAMEAQAMLEVSRATPRQIAQIVPSPMTLGFDRTIIEMLSAGFIGDLITLDARIADGSNFPQWDSRVHWRQDRDLSGNNIMGMGIWYEGFLRWVGPARSVQAVGQSVVKHRLDANGRRVPMTIPDHVDIMGEMEQGGQYRMSVSAAVGHVPGVDIYLCGTQGTIRLSDSTGSLALTAGARGARKLAPVKIPKSKIGGWRVEEEFINAIRGKEVVSHTDFVSAVKYMEWTDAVSSAVRTGRRIQLPLEAGAPA